MDGVIAATIFEPGKIDSDLIHTSRFGTNSHPNPGPPSPSPSLVGDRDPPESVGLDRGVWNRIRGDEDICLQFLALIS